MNTPLSWQPLHLQVRNALLERIAAGEWTQGAPLPSEIELAQEYGLSTGTIRKALDWLDQARILVRQQGRGTFVRDQSAAENEERYEKLCKTSGAAFATVVENVSVNEAVADDDECTKLKIPHGSLVWRIECLRTIDGRAHTFELSSVSQSLIRTCGSARYSLAELARAHGLLLGQATEHVCIGTPPNWAAERMGIASGTPLLVLDRIIQTVQGMAVEWRKCYCATADAHYSALIG